MLIANPIYDVVFKYLMEDSKIARLLIAAIIGEEIIDLDFLPQEHSIDTLKTPSMSLTVYRVDFRATIKTPEGSKCVLIEIQKAKFSTDIMRFRKYLGSQYSHKENTFQETVDGITITRALPIISIYFLGYPLENITAPVIEVKRHYYDAIGNTEINARVAFIESLTHDSFIVQIPYLHQTFRNDLECILSVFDQHNRTDDDHILNVKEDQFPEQYRLIIRRLQRAAAEQEVREIMDVEDDFLEELQDKERVIEKMGQMIEENKLLLDEKNQMLDEKNQTIEENKLLLDEKNQMLDEKEAMIEELRKQLRQLR